jgi:UDP-N-acetylmuramoyl-tripeptide--D-alanyl-D-alanine ligase
MVQIVKPEAGLITNIGTAHIGNLGSQKAIAEEKRTCSCPYLHGIGFMHEEEGWVPF